MKKIESRESFEVLCQNSAEKMFKDLDLLENALDVKVRAGHEYMYVHQTRWMGEPCLQLPSDLIALQEIIFKTKPDFIIECGVAWGGTTLFLASLMKLTGGKKVIGIDIFLPEDLITRIKKHEQVSDMIHLINGSTIEQGTLDKVNSIVNKSDKVMVILDSDHTHDHVLAELKLYSTLVGQGQYLVCSDTAIARQPPAPKRPRAWNSENNPHTALQNFLSSNYGQNFSPDLLIDHKLLMSNNWGGYLVKL
jgi:cephalosporin hydroxylase